MTLEIPDEVYEFLIPREEAWYEADQEAQQLREQADIAEDAIGTAKQKRTWGQKLTFRNRGGVKKAKQEFSTLEEQATAATEYADELDGEICDYVSGFLYENDPWFEHTATAHEQIGYVLDVTVDFLNAIGHARDEVSDAIGAEFYDGMTHSGMGDMWSYFETEQARNAIENVQQHAQHYQNVLNEFQEYVGRVDVGSIDDNLGFAQGMEFFSDFAFGGYGGFDFGSWIALDALHDAARDLDVMYQDIEGVHNHIQQNQVDLEESLEGVIEDFRKFVYDSADE